MCACALQLSESGARVWPARLVMSAGHSWLRLSTDAKVPLTLHIVDLDMYFASEYMCVTGYEAHVAFGARAAAKGVAGFGALLLSERPTPLLQYCARKAFIGLTVPLMNALIEIKGWEVPRPRPTLAKEVARLAVSRALPHLSADEVEEIVSLRGAPSTRHTLRPAIEVAEVLEGVVALEEIDEIMKDVRSEEPKPKKPRAKAVPKQMAAPPPAAAVLDAPAPPPAVLDAPAPEAPRTPRPLRPVTGDHFTVLEGREFMPKAPGYQLMIHTKRAWMAKCPIRSSPGPKSHTVTWTETIPHRKALLEVLAWSWARYKENGGHDCPWELSE